MNNLCSYGCGNNSKYILKNGKFCCSEYHSKCPELRKKNKESKIGRKSYIRSEETKNKMRESRLRVLKNKEHKKKFIISIKNRKTYYNEINNNTSILCSYGCGKLANFYFPKVKKYCCSNHYMRCAFQHKKTMDSWRDVEEVETMKRCSYGCNKKAKYRFKNGRFCCSSNHSSCSAIRKRNMEKNRIKQSGENNAMWKGGITFFPYSKEWTTGLKRKIIERDHYKCQNPDCSKKSDILCVHHIDFNKLNCDERNLITICNSCNPKCNFNREYWTEFYNNIIYEIYNGGIYG